MRRIFITPIFLFCFIINPAFMGGCGEVEDEFTYGEAELLELTDRVVDTSWVHRVNDAEYRLEFQLTQGSELQITQAETFGFSAAWACTERSFVRDADACVHMSRLALEGSLTVTNVETDEVVVDAAPIAGHLEAMGLHLSQARMFLTGDIVDIFLTSDDGEGFELTRATW